MTICSKYENQSIHETGKRALNALEVNDLGRRWDISAPNLLNILSALLEQIETKQSLSLVDAMIPSKNVPSLGSENAQRKYFSSNFLDTLYEGTDSECWALAATAENVAFDLPLKKRVTGGSVRDRQRKKE